MTCLNRSRLANFRIRRAWSRRARSVTRARRIQQLVSDLRTMGGHA